MKRWGELRDRDLRAVERWVRGLAEEPSSGAIYGRVVNEGRRLLPADCACLNTWTPAMDRPLHARANDEMDACLAALQTPLNATVATHPILAHDGAKGWRDHALRMSDYATTARFRQTPLFHEVYRHLDSHHQVTFAFADLSDRSLSLTWNLRGRDYTPREMQLLELMGRRLGALCLATDRRQLLERQLARLGRLVGDRRPPLELRGLRTREIRLLAALLRAGGVAGLAARRGIRRDTLDKQLGSVREQLGLESTVQLIGALAELRPHG